MKKTILTAVIALAFTGIVSAQVWGQNQGGAVQTITGTLALRNGTIILEENNQVYYVPALERFTGFIDGLKEGARVTIAGYVYGNQAYTYLQPAKLTLNGKDYEVGNTVTQGRSSNGYWGHGGHNRGYGGCH